MFKDEVLKEFTLFLPNYIVVAKQKDIHEEIMQAKMITSYILAKHYRLKLVEIAELLECKHSTVIYRIKACSDRLKYDKRFINKYNDKLNEIKRCSIY